MYSEPEFEAIANDRTRELGYGDYLGNPEMEKLLPKWNKNHSKDPVQHDQCNELFGMMFKIYMYDYSVGQLIKEGTLESSVKATYSRDLAKLKKAWYVGDCSESTKQMANKLLDNIQLVLQ